MRLKIVGNLRCVNISCGSLMSASVPARKSGIFADSAYSVLAQILARGIEDGEKLKVPAYIARAIEQLVVT